MSIAISNKTFKNNKTYTYIVENFRDPVDRKPTSRVLESFGPISDDPEKMEKAQERLEQYRSDFEIYERSINERMSSGAQLCASANTEEFNDCFSLAMAPYLKLWEKLGLRKYFKNVVHNNKLPFNLNKYVSYLCVNRILSPSSILQAWRLRNNPVFDFSELNLKHLYGTLDQLYVRKAAIVRALNDGVGGILKRDLTIALYDVTTLYFESFTEDELRKRGFSKEHRTQETQVVLGLLVDSNGIPIDLGLFPGNTSEGGTMMKVVDGYKEKYKPDSVTIIADAGLNRYLNLQQMQDKGYRYIVNFPPYQKMTDDDRKSFLDLAGWALRKDKDGNTWGYKETEIKIKEKVDGTDGEKVQIDLEPRIVGIFSSERRAHDLQVIEAKWQKAVALAAKGAKAYASSTRKGAKAYLNPTVSEVETNSEYYAEKIKWAGFIAIATNIPRSSEPAVEIYHLLRQLWKIEYNFRVLKTDIEARPMFVWTFDHIAGHVLLCYISLVVARSMRQFLLTKDIDLSEREIVNVLEGAYAEPLQSMRKGRSHLVSCLYCKRGESSIMVPGHMEPNARKLLCKKIFLALDIKPLNRIESDRTLSKKLDVKIPLRPEIRGEETSNYVGGSSKEDASPAARK